MTETHYRKAFNSPYLSAADIVEPVALTIAKVALEVDKTKQTKESRNTAYFSEKEIRPGEELKPMVLNVHNSEVLRDMCGTPFIEHWSGPVTVYVDKNVKFGRDIVEGLRLKPRTEQTLSEDEQASVTALCKEVGCPVERIIKGYKVGSLALIPQSKYSAIVKRLEGMRGE